MKIACLILLLVAVSWTAFAQGSPPTKEEIDAVKCPYKKCPSSGMCCKDDEFCLSGICHTCFPDKLNEDNERICAWCNEIGYRNYSDMKDPYPCRTACLTRCGPENVSQGANYDSKGYIIAIVLLSLALVVTVVMYLYRQCGTCFWFTKGEKNTHGKENSSVSEHENAEKKKTQDKAGDSEEELPLTSQRVGEGDIGDPQMHMNGKSETKESVCNRSLSKDKVKSKDLKGVEKMLPTEGDVDYVSRSQMQQMDDHNTGDSNTNTQHGNCDNAPLNGPKINESNMPHASTIATSKTPYKPK